MDIANLPRYEVGRCVSCGDCNREPAYVDEGGEWVKFEEAMEASSNSLQQLKAEIAAALDKGIYTYNRDNIVIVMDRPDYERLRQLSAV